MKPFVFSRPESVNQSVTKKNNKYQFIAGGTNLIDLMKKDISSPDGLLDITGVLSSEIKSSDKGILIGAMVRNSAATLDEKILSDYPLLAKAILAGASPQIRHMASTAGNMLQRTRCPYFYDTTLPCNKRKPGTGCGALKGENRMSAIVGWSNECVAVHPSDMCIALVALDASVVILGKDQKTTKIPFKDFHRLPGTTPQRDHNLPSDAIITGVEIPKNPYNKNYSYLKIRDRDSYAFALISVAAALELDGNKIVSARLASGGVAHKPWRWTASENFLKGKTATVENFRQAAMIAAKETKPLDDNKFKVTMLTGAIETALNNCLNV